MRKKWSLFSVASLRFIGSLVFGCLVLLCAQSLWAQQDVDRPHLSHQSQPISQDSTAIESPDSSSHLLNSGTPIEDGLTLPATGHVWAKDTFAGVRQLVQMKYVPTDIDRHAGSNILKANMAPFIYKPKESVEIQGAAASVRLHDPNSSIYIRGYGVISDEDAAVSSETSTKMDLALVKVESKKDRRIVSTIAFTQITGKAARNSQTIVITTERVGNTNWQRITPTEPLSPGEYVLMCMPKGQNLFPTRVFDFAIDPKAPANPNAIMPAMTTSSRQ